MRFGIILLIVGLLALLSNVGVLNERSMSVVWPVTLIVVGAWLMIRRGGCGRNGCWGGKNCNCHGDCDHATGVCKINDKSSK